MGNSRPGRSDGAVYSSKLTLCVGSALTYFHRALARAVPIILYKYASAVATRHTITNFDGNGGKSDASCLLVGKRFHLGSWCGNAKTARGEYRSGRRASQTIQVVCTNRDDMSLTYLHLALALPITFVLQKLTSALKANDIVANLNMTQAIVAVVIIVTLLL